MSETAQPNPESTSIYKQFEGATQKYYDADDERLRFVPVAHNKDVAHAVALAVEQQLSSIDPEEITKQAENEEARYKLGKITVAGVEKNKQELLDYRLRNAVVNAEMTHAALAPEDFGLDAQKAGAYQMGNGTSIPNPHKPEA